MDMDGRCTWLGPRGICGKQGVRGSDRCSAHRDKAQMRYCAYDRCQTRVADVEGQLCYRHRKQAEMKQERAEARASEEKAAKPSKKVDSDYVDTSSLSAVRAAKKKAPAPHEEEEPKRRKSKTNGQPAAPAKKKSARAANQKEEPKAPTERHTRGSTRGRRDNVLSSSTSDLRALKKKLDKLSLSSSDSSSEPRSRNSSSDSESS